MELLPADPVARLELIANGLEMLTGAEAAIRAWARTHPVLANGLSDLQQAANAVLVGTLSEITGDPELAGVMQQ